MKKNKEIDNLLNEVIGFLDWHPIRVIKYEEEESKIEITQKKQLEIEKKYSCEKMYMVCKYYKYSQLPYSNELLSTEQLKELIKINYNEIKSFLDASKRMGKYETDFWKNEGLL